MWQHRKATQIDCAKEAKRISAFILEQVTEMKRRGAVIGLSGGIDSALCAVLCLKALGKERILGVILPERESNPLSTEYALMHAKKIGLKTETVDITPILEELGVYSKRDAVIKANIPEYNHNFKSKIALPDDLLQKDSFNFFRLIYDDSSGNTQSIRLDNRSLRGIVAATNMKQRVRMLQLYHFAEKNNYLVCGTTNRDEYIQGFFVKYGDGGVDIEPIVHLYKTQVYSLARHLGVIDEIIERKPSPDTYSLAVSDEEMYFRIPFEVLDPLLYAWENRIDINEVCASMNLTPEQVERVFRNFSSKYKATEYLRKQPVSIT
jgi:NAD+ synthase